MGCHFPVCIYDEPGGKRLEMLKSEAGGGFGCRRGLPDITPSDLLDSEGAESYN
ncbi:hypothetical protein ACFLTW_05040 [Chloroflexota bacterium]